MSLCFGFMLLRPFYFFSCLLRSHAINTSPMALFHGSRRFLLWVHASRKAVEFPALIRGRGSTAFSTSPFRAQNCLIRRASDIRSYHASISPYGTHDSRRDDIRLADSRTMDLVTFGLEERHEAVVAH
ncbi:hypothetical protein BDN71DRAFT_897310 [Pleurotus eryngii]|uniref:Secreted protein n=1 Tax=Pleurotus eryngii TaxID=5323 RepID=A0A9P5ZVG8_PLEER|nr:hypothetical protein BDN71DRAFT_897310 [Pleurotus eryngii]